MRRVLTTLMILLVVLVAGISALVLLVNPNDFRAYMVQQVEARSGYQLQLDEPLRWHVWPQLSILSGRMSLTAPGASTPLVSAANMRLDVELWPLLSHQLHVKQVMLKGAVIQLTPQTKAARKPDAPVAPDDNPMPQVDADRGWSYAISRLQVADSVLVFQHENEEQVTVRDIRLNMEQDASYHAVVDFSGRINRNQRDLTLAMKANIDAADYPHNLDAAIEQFDWQLKGGDVAPQGISGTATLNARWQEAQKRISFSNLNVTANDSTLSGQGSVVLNDTPDWALDLHFDKLNLENLLSGQTMTDASSDAAQKGQAQAKLLPRPVIASDSSEPEYTSLRGFTARVALTAGQIRWRGMDFTDVSSEMTNQAGLLTLSTLQGKMGNGTLSLPGRLDVRGRTPKSAFKPTLENVEIGTILKAFDYPIALTGAISMNSDFTGNQVDAMAFRHDWQGSAHLEMANVQMEGLNFQQLIQQAVARSSDVKVEQDYDNTTRLDALSTDLELDHGTVTLSDLQGSSPLIALDGQGTLDLVNEESDTQFNVRVLSGWNGGNSELITFLRKTPIPISVYGKWDALQYNLKIDQVLRDHLQGEAKRRLNKWADRNKDSKYSEDVKKLLEKM
ncbi:outer membrane assembly protein AsmA [Enterobacter sp. ENT03]|uniref:outer membrane assembly protein AsmA n=1 Tax=Enterobacter sp. ENT03 TaxID=2854780 RepID=UPI001C48EDE8|nr:outer membrane assembly protein AsmA [Enterobacter sp. ENT03]MBV7405729.1 outer membrane assembly protein AsmA [Enterobacter sp. ENT03]